MDFNYLTVFMQKSEFTAKNRKLDINAKKPKDRLPQPGMKTKVTSKIPQPTLDNGRRLWMVWGVLGAASLGLAINLYQLQIVRSPQLLAKARKQQMVQLRPFIPRRPVVDRNKNVLAIDRPVYTLFAHPKLFKKPASEIASQLATLLHREPADLEKLLLSRTSGITVASGVLEEIANQITSARLDGLELIQKYSRLYPQQDLVADIVGYVNLDRRGQAGVEYSQEKLLERSVQMVRMSRAGNGALMPDRAPGGFLHYDDLRLQLTVDVRLQRIATDALQQQITKFHAKRGAVIVMDARDGSLIALASHPSYNPNEYSKADMSLFKNWALSDLYEPGSTFKPLNIAIALENNAITPENTFNDPGSIQIGEHTIKNAENKSYGRINIAQILQHSSNIGMVQVIQRLKPSVYYGWLEKLGLGQTIDTDLPSPAASQLKSQEKFISSPIEPATTSFGQGFSLTPLQLVQMQAALANGGKLVTPHVVQGLFDTKGQAYWQPTLPAPRQIFSPVTAQTVVEMMETVVTKGTGKAAQIPGYRIAGKTGTAQKASNTGGYRADAKITSFIGIMPVESPRYVILAIVDEPQGSTAFGSTVAAPIAKKVMEGLINIEQIPPTQPMTPTNATLENPGTIKARD